jgi:hypothetical protein
MSFPFKESFPTHPAKIKAIEALTIPNDKAGLDTALGIMGYHRKFILNCGAIAEPLRLKANGGPHTWRKGADGTVPWTEKETTTFIALRSALTGDSILKHPNWDHPFELHTDASHQGLGAGRPLPTHRW